MGLSKEEFTDIHFMYGRANGNAKLAAKLYKKTFPDRRCPHYLLFSEIDRRLRKRGSFRKKKQTNKEKERTASISKLKYNIVKSEKENLGLVIKIRKSQLRGSLKKCIHAIFILLSYLKIKIPNRE